MPMDPFEAQDLIDKAGGPKALADLLKLDGDGAVQRVSNWRHRGIPSAIVVMHYQTLKKLRAAPNKKAS